MKLKLEPVLAVLLFLLAAEDVWPGNLSEEVVRPVRKSVEIRQATQREEDRWAAEKSKLQSEYKRLCEERERLLATNENLKKRFDNHNKTIEKTKKEIKEIKRIEKEVLPYLHRVYDRLLQTVADSLPFLENERKKRLERLSNILDDPKVSIAEKFRKTLETLQIEAEYGNSVEAYQKDIEIDGDKICVNILRLGRLALFFQTLDRKQAGMYDPAKSIWVRLPERLNEDIEKAIDIAEKRRSIELLTLPLGKIAAQ